jgi:hypothetical protein
MTDTAWDTYRLAADGADDVRLQRRDQRMKGGGEKVNLDVWTRGGLHIGQRQIVSMEAKVGDIYWVRTTDPALDESDQSQDSADVSGDSYPHDATRVRLVAEMKAAFLWRGPGKGEAEKRVPAILLPCTNPDSLCISCRVFGMTGEQNDTKGAAEHRAYRGHVRIGDALAMGAVELLGVALAPLGAPRPGAGQMYLVHDGKPATTRDDLPTREWGAAPDDGGPRPLRGRKYYWHGDPNVQYPPRYRERRHQAGKAMGGEVQAAPPGSEFQAEVTFENLDAAEIGGLMAAFDPALVLKDSYVPPGLAASQVLHRIGGGKPLGLGTVEVKIEPQSFLAESAAARYLGEADHALPSVESCIDAFVVSVPGAVRQVWPDLAAVLDFGHVDPRFIWYPPGDTWSRAGTEPFDQGFEFWKENSGRFLANDPVDMVALPPPRDADQYLAIVPRRRPGRGKAKP